MTRGVVIAAARSGAGKTTVALGLMRAFARRGIAVQPFKCGPDYIDPAFHHVATGRPSFNLDGWAMDAGTLSGLVGGHAADLAIAEGVMGLFDGVGGRGATADVAALLGWPVVLVLDVKGQTETAAAIAAGCAAYRADVEIAGVILNRVASERHLSLIAPAFDRIGITLELTFLSLAVAVALAIPLGAAMAYMRGSRLDLAMRVVTVSGVTMPSFWLGALLIYLAALWLPAWPTIGAIPAWSEDPLKHLQRMLLPTLVTALPALSSLARIIRSAMLDALSQDYVRTARAKGLGEGSVVFKHALLNSLIPFVTALGITTGYLFGGAIVVEQVFAIPGLGRLIVGAIADRNYPLIQAAILVVTVGFVAINAVIDILYVVIDRRVAL